MKKSLLKRRFGYLSVVAQAPHTVDSKVRWLCKCKCGGEITAYTGNLEHGYTKSCGCLRTKLLRARAIHGRAHKGDKTYEAWCNMIKRCATSASNKDSFYYSKRGIAVCTRWRESFVNFLTDMGDCPSGKSLDRWPDNNSGYRPDNCRWATAAQQAANRRLSTKTALMTCYGETKHLAAWAKDARVVALGLKMPTLQARRLSGWAPEQVLTSPLYTRIKF